MSDIQPYAPPTSLGSSSLAPWSSQGRALSRIVSQAELQVARTSATAYVESAKLDAIDQVTQRALQGTAMVAQLESQLAEAVPSAAFRLAQIAQAHTLSMVGEVHSFGRGLRERRAERPRCGCHPRPPAGGDVVRHWDGRGVAGRASSAACAG